jgi:hypothetical protein
MTHTQLFWTLAWIYALGLAYLWAVRRRTRTLDQIRHRLDRRIETVRQATKEIGAR